MDCMGGVERKRGVRDDGTAYGLLGSTMVI